jgi:hypothetical protein
MKYFMTMAASGWRYASLLVFRMPAVTEAPQCWRLTFAPPKAAQPASISVVGTVIYQEMMRGQRSGAFDAAAMFQLKHAGLNPAARQSWPMAKSTSIRSNEHHEGTP